MRMFVQHDSLFAAAANVYVSFIGYRQFQQNGNKLQKLISLSMQQRQNTTAAYRYRYTQAHIHMHYKQKQSQPTDIRSKQTRLDGPHQTRCSRLVESHAGGAKLNHFTCKLVQSWAHCWNMECECAPCWHAGVPGLWQCPLPGCDPFETTSRGSWNQQQWRPSSPHPTQTYQSLVNTQKSTIQSLPLDSAALLMQILVSYKHNRPVVLLTHCSDQADTVAQIKKRCA